jgi:DNA-binding sugar fermentation-stimulating protein
LVEKGKTIYVVKGNKSSKTQYTAQLAECSDETGAYYVGIHPLVSQNAARELLTDISSDAVWKSEVVVDTHTRIDYVGICPNGKKIYVEVKTAMISTQCNVSRDSRRAVFPEGYRKNKTDTISPRAVKHAEVLAELMKREDTEMCVLLFVVPRVDCDGGLDINDTDPIYRNAVREAQRAGVVVRAFSLNYSKDGSITKHKDLPVFI